MKKKQTKEAKGRLCLEGEESAVDDLDAEEQNPFFGVEFLFSAQNLSEFGTDAVDVH